MPKQMFALRSAHLTNTHVRYYLLLVQEHNVRKPLSLRVEDLLTCSEHHMSKVDPEPQLIAEAIGTFYEDNKARRVAGLPPL